MTPHHRRLIGHCAGCARVRELNAPVLKGRVRQASAALADVEAQLLNFIVARLRCSQCQGRAIAWAPVPARRRQQPGVETMHFSLRHERMNRQFEKWHLGGLPFPVALHRFTGPDHGSPHDHPWGFRTHILSGGYVEEVFHVAPDRPWRSEIMHRVVGSDHHVAAAHIHRIIDLPEGECWTLVQAGPEERETRFWRFTKGRAASRAWHERRYV